MNEKRRILIVDDDKVVRLVLGGGLKKHGYEVVEAASGEEAKAILATEALDLAIVDYKMPNMSGLALTETFKDVHGLPFLFLTAYKDEAIVRQAIAQGAYGYLIKPVTVEELLPMIEAALERTAETKHVNRALTETTVITLAIGILMAERHLTDDQAREHLRAICRPRGLTARAYAKRIVEGFETYLADRARFDAILDGEPASANGGGTGRSHAQRKNDKDDES